MSVHSAPHSFMVISDPRTTAIFTHCIVVISCHQHMKVGDLLAMTAMTLLDDSRWRKRRGKCSKDSTHSTRRVDSFE
jgi:hypothetical protein